MKSLFLSCRSPHKVMIAAVFWLLMSCSNNSDRESPSADSTAVMADSIHTITKDSISVTTDSTRAILRPGSATDSGVIIKRPSRGPVSTGLDSAVEKAHVGKTEIDTTSAFHTRKDSAVANMDKLRKAVFGYSFFKNIQQSETRNINAYISVINAVSKVIDTLKQINLQDIPERKNDTATILTRNILFFKALTVQLVNAGDSDFVIKSFAESRQIIDSVNGNSWTWAVTPHTSKSHGRLIMNVVAEKPDGSREPFSTISIPITISLNKEINRTIWQWMMDNPEKVLTIILIPLVIFFWKQISGLFKKKEPGNHN